MVVVYLYSVHCGIRALSGVIDCDRPCSFMQGPQIAPRRACPSHARSKSASLLANEFPFNWYAGQISRGLSFLGLETRD